MGYLYSSNEGGYNIFVKSPDRYFYFIICWLLALGYLVSGCLSSIPRFGLAGRYQGGRDQFLKGRGGDMDVAVSYLESVVSEQPTYKDSLTLLARAYYRKQRYADAMQIVQRALAVNKDDEVAWLVLGLSQLRLRMDSEGMEALKGGITLVAKVSNRGYRGYPEWDLNGLVRNAIRRAAFQVTKGLDDKPAIFQSVEALLIRMDDEEGLQRHDILPQH
jgi:tetratricopeptide (TPR) repeat protein